MNSEKHIHHTVDHLFRIESGKMVAVLVKIFGTDNLELAEDVVQESLISALENWKYNGMPDNPRAWLYRVARNKAIDIIRKNKFQESFDFSDPKRQLLQSEYTLAPTMDNFWMDESIQDDFLGMMFACCHPEISSNNQITFILKSLCGFSTKEVARSFLTSEDTVSKRLYRTKEFFREQKIRPEMPTADEIMHRTGSVLSAIYLLFNEGYNATHSDQIIRNDLIAQAMYLCNELLSVPKTRLPEVYALMALMCFHAARTDSRVGPGGDLILLADQDRTTWNQELIRKGIQCLGEASAGNVLSSYHFEAAIAHEHCVAQSYETTNWKVILGYYDQLSTRYQDPLIQLNRSLVILEIHGPERAMESLKELESNAQLRSYYLYHAILGEVHLRLAESAKAIDSLEMALRLTQSEQEKRFLTKKIESISGF